MFSDACGGKLRILNTLQRFSSITVNSVTPTLISYTNDCVTLGFVVCDRILRAATTLRSHYKNPFSTPITCFLYQNLEYPIPNLYENVSQDTLL
ncbi:hypothetical protein LC653_29030 [Nostoc sp. CHAB 5784]|uniref:hypothetical protein n=1 Tax=Nostoc mirabile TaxID=2907820 RepID=UPI001E61EFEC|nr:hypothetical protein [Nostoc mirabile]MCC5667814.1 hypothetical protein [Nostoc mirabile CHAB5784]